MASTGLHFLFDLPAELGRLIHDFLFRPGDSADPKRVELPEPFGEEAIAARAAALECGLLGPRVGAVDAEACLRQIDWGSPLHRVAILPREALEGLAWYEGLASLRDRLRRIVARDELRALHAQGLAADHLAFVYQIPDPSRTAEVELTGSLGTPPLTPQQVFTEGWALLAAVATLLPPPLAARLQLKLPPDAPIWQDQPARLRPVDPVFEWVRSRVVSAWRPDFDERLAALAARAPN